ncbi:hypothetical protein RB599_006968 [Gaeumannomyces hyphopodioides]
MLALDCGTTDPAETVASLALYPRRYVDMSNDECQVICYHHGNESGGWLEQLKNEKTTLENENRKLVAENNNLKAENRNLGAEKDRLETRVKMDAYEKRSLTSKLATVNLDKRWLVGTIQNLQHPAYEVFDGLRYTLTRYEESEAAERADQAEKAERAKLSKLAKQAELAMQAELAKQAEQENQIKQVKHGRQTGQEEQIKQSKQVEQAEREERPQSDNAGQDQATGALVQTAVQITASSSTDSPLSPPPNSSRASTPLKETFTHDSLIQGNGSLQAQDGSSEQPPAEMPQPAPNVSQPALDMPQPASEVLQPAPNMSQPAPNVPQPASEMRQPAPDLPQPAPELSQPALEPPEVPEMPEHAGAPGPSASGTTKRSGDHEDEGGAVANKRLKTASDSDGQQKPELPGAFTSIGLADIGHLFDLTRKVVPEIAWTQVRGMKPMPRAFEWPEGSGQVWILRCPFHLDRKPCPLSGNTGWYDILPAGGRGFGVNHLCAEHQYPHLDLKTLVEKHGTRIIPNAHCSKMLKHRFAAKVLQETEEAHEEARAVRMQRARDAYVQAYAFRKNLQQGS